MCLCRASSCVMCTVWGSEETQTDLVYTWGTALRCDGWKSRAGEDTGKKKYDLFTMVVMYETIQFRYFLDTSATPFVPKYKFSFVYL